MEKEIIENAITKHARSMGEIVRTAFEKHFGYHLDEVKDPENLVQLSELGGSTSTLLYRGEAFLKIERAEIEVDPYLRKPEIPQVKLTTRYTEL